MTYDSGRFRVRFARLSVSFIGPAMFRLLPGLMIAHRAAHADVDVRLFERTSPDQMQGILDGTFDIADADGDGVMIAQAGELRSRAIAVRDGATLVVEPTSHRNEVPMRAGNTAWTSRATDTGPYGPRRQRTKAATDNTERSAPCSGPLESAAAFSGPVSSRTHGSHPSAPATRAAWPRASSN